jgi:hypothetical protein
VKACERVAEASIIAAPIAPLIAKEVATIMKKKEWEWVVRNQEPAD